MINKMEDSKITAHSFLVDKGVKSVSDTFTAFQVERMLDEYTEQLKNELEGIKEVYKDLQSINDFGTKCLKEKELFINSLQSQLSEKDKELSELKAKHEKDVKMAWQKGSESWIRGSQTAEQYYTQTHGQ